MPMPRRSSFWALPVIAGLVYGVYLGSMAFAAIAGLPWDLGLPWPVRLAGLLPLAYGVTMTAWAVRHRGFGPMLDSTWITFRKLMGREPVAAAAGRTEPLVVAGPYRLVRHPLYSGVDGLVAGIALLVDHPWAYLAAAAIWLWFAFVLAPFEERELVALFGSAYEKYIGSHRRFLPFPRRAG